jgi:hypothetical protein
MELLYQQNTLIGSRTPEISALLKMLNEKIYLFCQPEIKINGHLKHQSVSMVVTTQDKRYTDRNTHPINLTFR